MARKRTGYSKKSKDWLGRPIVEHFNSRREKTGHSKNSKNFWGKPITERFNAKKEKTGYNRDTKTIWGSHITERFNSKGERIGYNKPGNTFWGTPLTEQFNAKGEKTGYSKRATNFWGTPITEHYNESAADPSRSFSSSLQPEAASESFGSRAPSSSGSAQRLIIGGVVVLAFALVMSDTFRNWIAERLTRGKSNQQVLQSLPFNRNQQLAISSFLRAHPDMQVANCQTLGYTADACNQVYTDWKAIVLNARAELQYPFAAWGDFNQDGLFDFVVPFFGRTNVNSWGWRKWSLVVFQGNPDGHFTAVTAAEDQWGVCFDGLLYHPVRKQIEYWCKSGGGSFRWNGSRYVAQKLVGD